MAQKNEAPALIASLLITAGLLGGGVWWWMQRTSNPPGQGENSAASSQGNSTQGNSTQGNSTQETGSQSTTEPGTATTTPNPTNLRSFSDVPDVPEGLFNYGGSTTWAPVRGEVDPEIRSAWSRFQLRYTDPVTGTPGSSAGIRMLLSNQLAFAQSSRPLASEEYQEAQQRGFTLREVPVAIEGIAVSVHPDSAVTGLTLEQIKGIYTGRITNWSEVGGSNGPITPYSRRLEDGGTVDFFVENVLEGEALGSTVQFLVNTTTAIRQLSENPGGIYYASAPEIVGQCTIKPIALGRRPDELITPYQVPLIPPDQCPAQRNQLNVEAFRSGDYPLTRRMFVIIKQDGQLEQQAGEAYANLLLTLQGQESLRRAGFVPLR
ncbi:PstS family phosphate ABC transporter substrate-binding protein [Egbenema bharatensis]|uniref:PstS family phosphate ABC transporter substrate-binding protein n=1 Tax=Egbenema bharatensis TaxID=3463334 RepID=UPI003A869CDC